MRASGQFALTWQIARQRESATGGTNSSVAFGEFFAFYASIPRKSSQFLTTPGSDGWIRGVVFIRAGKRRNGAITKPLLRELRTADY